MVNHTEVKGRNNTSEIKMSSAYICEDNLKLATRQGHLIKFLENQESIGSVQVTMIIRYNSL